MRTSHVSHETRTVWHLQAARTLRSVGQGIAVVNLALYLKDLNWSAAAIGGVLTGAGVMGAVLMLVVGVSSDRWGRKPFLLTYEAITAVAAVLLVLTHNPDVLVAIIVVTSFGRGQNGAAGPFTPAEQAWMARVVPRPARGRVFSVNTALGFFGMAFGAVLAGAKGLFGAGSGPASFHPLFYLRCLAWLRADHRHRAGRARRCPPRRRRRYGRRGDPA
jgi:MFS family permease